MNKQYTDVMGRFVTNRALIEPFAVERKEVDGSIQYHLTLNDESVGCVSVGPATSGTISITWYEDGKTKGIEAGAGEAINKIPFNLPPPAGDLWRILKTYLRMNLASVPTPAEVGAGGTDSDLPEPKKTILKMWCEGYTGKEIGETVSLSPGHVANIVTELRKDLGVEQVPYHRKS